MGPSFFIPDDVLSEISHAPEQVHRAQWNGEGFNLRIGIPHYAGKIERHYDSLLPQGLEALCRAHVIVPPFRHFGLTCEFSRAVELPVHDDHYVLDKGIRELVSRFGPVMFKNAHLREAIRAKGQRNIFPNLRFHFDRGSNQEEQYSFFSRDPFDAVQRFPRESSTLFIANAVAYLQGLREKQFVPAPGPWHPASHILFARENMAKLVGTVALEYPWSAPEGVGELCILDNRPILHASYYPRGYEGYPIGVRYLA